METVEPTIPADVEYLAHRDNARAWRRRAVVMTLCVTLGVPTCGVVFWNAYRAYLRSQGRLVDGSDAPAPRDAELIQAYREYMFHEGHGNRSWRFYRLAFSIALRVQGTGGTQQRTVSEEELLYYLGRPDTTATKIADGSVVYEYRMSDEVYPPSTLTTFTLKTVDGRRVVADAVFPGMQAQPAVQPTTTPATAPTTNVVGAHFQFTAEGSVTVEPKQRAP
jgi:hypothetical protein